LISVSSLKAQIIKKNRDKFPDMEFNQATESSFLNQGAQSFFNQPMDPFYNHQATTEPILNHSAESFFNNQAMTVDTTFHNNHHHQATTTTALMTTSWAPSAKFHPEGFKR